MKNIKITPLRHHFPCRHHLRRWFTSLRIGDWQSIESTSDSATTGTEQISWDEAEALIESCNVQSGKKQLAVIV